jgi:succinate dehydrogenase / fumarate reductase cytochrome b subunit
VNFTGKDFASLHDHEGRHDVYRMMVIGFSNPLVSLFYLVGMALLCLHLSHGVHALFQSLGLKNPHYDLIIKRFARIAAVAIFIGYASIPLAVLTGLVK